MPERRLRVGLDANVLIAGARVPRWPYEVMRAALGGHFTTVLPVQVVEEARRHLQGKAQTAFLQFFLSGSEAELVAMPAPAVVAAGADLIRSAIDMPIALSLLEAEVDIFVTNDRDFTDPGATASRFSERVKVMLPAVFLRDVLGWRPEALESIRNRSWRDMEPLP
jgi:predicted nucleic acid-binding protein